MIFFEDPYTLEKVQVPPAIVRDCASFIGVKSHWTNTDIENYVY